MAGVVLAVGAASGAVSPRVSTLQLQQQCDADAKTVETAVAAYDANPPAKCTASSCTIGFEKLVGFNSITPGQPRTYWHGTQARKLLSPSGSAGLYIWPENSHFGISLAIQGYPRRAQAGEVLLYIPATNPHPTIYDDETSTSGCNSNKI